MGACEISEEDPNGERVYVDTIDDISYWIHPKGKITLLKIDVEWHEPQVLKGAERVLREDKPLVLIEDTDRQYEKLFPENYKLLYEWKHHNTYLYGVV